MPRPGQKERTYEVIVENASNLLRREGIAAASVSRVMQSAGMTVGGFYAHFASKSHLAAAALRRGFEENMGALFEGLNDAPSTVRYDAAVRRYLSQQHRDHEAQSCPVPACLSEVDPNDEVVRDALLNGVETLVTRLTPLFRDEPGLTARQRALGTVATFVGAMALARATKGTKWSDEVLLASRKLLFRIEGDFK